MLGKAMFAKLSKQNWIDAMKKENNPSQTWARTKGKSVRALKELVILADVLPDAKQGEIFSEENVERLVSAILRQPFWNDPDHDKIDLRRIRLAAVLAEASLNKCIEKYKTQIESSPALNKHTISQLNDSIDICKQISLRIDSGRRDLKDKR
jgi:hypothetical protein